MLAAVIGAHRRRADALMAEHDGSEQSRNRIIEACMFQVELSAMAYHTRNPATDLDDLKQEGVFGVINAIKDYNPDKGVSFAGTYLPKKLFGAMADSMRREDWAPRVARAQARRLEHARETLTQTLGRPPGEEEAQLEVKGRDDWMNRMGWGGRYAPAPVPTITSLSRKIKPHAEMTSSPEFERVEMMPGNIQQPWQRAISKETMVQALMGLARHERLIIILYYVEDMTMKEIGKVIGMSESRVSQIHTRLMLRLRAKLTRSE